MENKYTFWSVFFGLLFLITLCGFSFTYLKNLQGESSLPLVIHVHFAAFSLWFLILITQPLLIRYKQIRWHANLGKFTYGLIILLVSTILILLQMEARRVWPKDPEHAAVGAFISLLDAVSILVYFSIAMKNNHRLRWHVAFIVGCSIVILNPGLFRVARAIQPDLGLPATVFMPMIITSVILLVERIKWKRPILKNPFFYFLLAWLFEIFLLSTLASTDTWRGMVERYII
ncbi:hypothetical protein [Leadbetterella byssophila]|uniref:hypothetical protein n=1 Tax=Leadbetterella byssophila TaxID=316068 RepID=UPI0039A2F396